MSESERTASLKPEQISAHLCSPRIGRQIVVFRETSSTNDRIRQAGQGGEEEGLVIFAESQTAGRGTYGRKWISGPGVGLWFSILLRSQLSLEQLPLIIQAAALATAEAVEEWVPERVKIKLPNDLYLQNGKLAGFLLETSSDWGFQVLGIGINVSQAPNLPGYPAIAMEHFSTRQIPRAEFAAQILSRFEAWYLHRRVEEWTELFERWPKFF
jgi:BirA family biotin operon repressor/biotin-[acetyl-CoA-carboxylase] ligase